ncbi:MAG: glutamine amidotransferase [Halocynthiibacter sp.]
MKPFLILQLRPEAEASDNEFEAFLEKGGLVPAQTHRIRLEQKSLPADLNLSDYAGVIVGGGPGCVSDDPATKPEMEARIEAEILSLMPEITERDIPYLGCCYGHGILGHHLGADVSKERFGEDVGTADCHITDAGAKDPITAHLPPRFDAFVGHKEALQELPKGCVQLISSPTCPQQMIRYGENVYSTQFHPEADGRGFAKRVEIYKHKGYFAPEDAETLTKMCLAADIHAPEGILKAFVARFGG